MARLSQIAYLGKKQATSLKKDFGFTGHKFFETEGAQAHAFWNKSEYVLAFRGTEPSELSDVLADLNILPRSAMTHGLVHSGFRDQLDNIWDDITKHHNTHTDKTLYITGHSLGAAMATIATSRFEEFITVAQLTTFGSPRVGTRKFVKNITTPHLRFVNNNDVVPKIPLFLMGYKHHGILQYLNFYGNLRKLTPWQALKDKWRGYRLFDGARDHLMVNYIEHTKDM